MADVSDIEVKYVELHRILDEIESLHSDGCTESTVAALAVSHEKAVRRMGSIGVERIAEVAYRAAYQPLGHTSLLMFLSADLRITHPRRTLRLLEQVSSRQAITGELLPPRCAGTAEAFSDGDLGIDHVNAVLDIIDKIPAAIPQPDRDDAEQTLADLARTLTPREITRVGTRLLAHLDPDGAFPSDHDRARRRSMSLGPQDSSLMSRLTGTLDPTTRALFDVVLAAWAAPGMNNPDDGESPRGGSGDEHIDAERVRAAADRDRRTPGQRQHDALAALLRAACDGGLLGASHRGLPPHIIVSVTEQQLRERAGIAHTTTGADLPMSDVLALAADAQMHLSVFDDVTGAPLFYGRSRRLASQSQRFTLFAQYGGCSRPHCPAPFSDCEIHHAEQDWAHGGSTDVTDLAPACGPDNRAVGTETGQQETVKITDGPDRGRYGWRRRPPDGAPPDDPRVNGRHRLAELLDRARQHAVDPITNADHPPDIDVETAQISPVEHGLALKLRITIPTAQVDYKWLRTAG